MKPIKISRCSRLALRIMTPMCMSIPQGDYAGIDIDIAREACKRAGTKPQFVDISWNDRDRLLKNGDIDCLWCDYSPNYREDDYYWTEPYLTLTVSVAAKKTSGITSLAHLDGSKTIAVIAGSVSERRLLAGDLEISPDVQIKSYGSAELCKAALAKGYVDCWMADVQSLDRLVAQYPGVYRVFADNVMTWASRLMIAMRGSTSKTSIPRCSTWIVTAR